MTERGFLKKLVGACLINIGTSYSLTNSQTLRIKEAWRNLYQKFNINSIIISLILMTCKKLNRYLCHFTNTLKVDT